MLSCHPASQLTTTARVNPIRRISNKIQYLRINYLSLPLVSGLYIHCYRSILIVEAAYRACTLPWKVAQRAV